MSKYVEVRGVKIGEGVPKICVPIVGKTKEECHVVVNGAGSAGVAITKLLLRYGFKDVVMCDKSGILSKASNDLNWMQKEMMEVTNLTGKTGKIWRNECCVTA